MEATASVCTNVAQDLTVPLARSDDGSIVTPDEADKKQRYFCVQCEVQLRLRKGDKRRHHFSHPPGTGCDPETLAHRLGKLLVKKVIDDAAARRGELPKVTATCPDCNRAFQRALRRPKGRFQALEEQTLTTGHRIDVLVLVQREPELGVEIVVHNPVNAAKAITLPIRWLQLSASDLIADPMLWKVTDGSLLCDECEATAKTKRPSYRSIKGALERSTPSGPPVVPKGFTCAPARCWAKACKQVIPIFDWLRDEKGHPVHKDHPEEIEFRYVKRSNSYCYVNVCPWCNVTQGPSKVLQDVVDFARDLMAKPPTKGVPWRARERSGSG